MFTPVDLAGRVFNVDVDVSSPSESESFGRRYFEGTSSVAPDNGAPSCGNNEDRG